MLHIVVRLVRASTKPKDLMGKEAEQSHEI